MSPPAVTVIETIDYSPVISSRRASTRHVSRSTSTKELSKDEAKKTRLGDAKNYEADTDERPCTPVNSKQRSDVTDKTLVEDYDDYLEENGLNTMSLHELEEHNEHMKNMAFVQSSINNRGKTFSICFPRGHFDVYKNDRVDLKSDSDGSAASRNGKSGDPYTLFLSRGVGEIMNNWLEKTRRKLFSNTDDSTLFEEDNHDKRSYGLLMFMFTDEAGSRSMSLTPKDKRGREGLPVYVYSNCRILDDCSNADAKDPNAIGCLVIMWEKAKKFNFQIINIQPLPTAKDVTDYMMNPFNPTASNVYTNQAKVFGKRSTRTFAAIQ